MAEPGPERATDRTAGRTAGREESQSHPVKTHRPQESGVTDLPLRVLKISGWWWMFELSGEGAGTSPRSPVRPWPPQQPLARRPQAHLHRPAAVFAPSSLQQGRKCRVPNPTGQRISAPYAKFTQEASPPAS
uniref:Uncharacterized protein n=1 Tax=Desmodus rotundus TaxID=9430 RepID=K9IY74_DESRO